MPDGFTDLTSTRKLTQTGSSTFTTVIGPSGSRQGDEIVVQQYGLPVDADTLDDAALQNAFAPTMASFAQTTNTSITPANPAIVQVDGVRTLVYDQAATGSTGKLQFLFRGRTEIQINCTYTHDRADIEKGCDAVRQSMQVISP